MRPPNTVILGHICIDRNKAEHASYTSWGSSALYTARYFQDHFGCEPAVISAYGADFADYRGDFMLYPENPNAEHTLVYENIVKDNKRTQYAHYATDSVEPQLTEEIIGLIETAEILIVATLLPGYSAQYIQEALSHARPSCLKVLIVQGYLRSVDADDLVGIRDFPEAAGVLPNFDITVFSNEDHPRIEELAHVWKKQSPNTNIIMTQGPKGASIVEVDGRMRNIPTTPVPPEDIVDSVGCGDVFTAALAYHYFKGKDLAAAITAAHRAARHKLLATNLDSSLKT
jgi:sugar/nucleoside kinase (ribokinase family)